MSKIFTYLNIIDGVIWEKVGIIMILVIGAFLTLKSKGYQFRVIFSIKQHAKEVFRNEKGSKGISPLRIYFASVGGMIGIGNIVGVVSAVALGGPGSLIWMWISVIFGMLVKYSEIFLGMKYRICKDDGYSGGPMYYLQEAFKFCPVLARFLPITVCLILCFYGVEISQFVIIADSISSTFTVNRYAVICLMIIVIVFSAMGGVSWLGKFCGILMPPFMISYMIFGSYIIFVNYHAILDVFSEVIESAFAFKSVSGGIMGSGMMLAARHGASRAVYSGDIGIGYDSMVHSESKNNKPSVQAKMAIFALLSDALICTFSVMIVLMTGVWRKVNLLPSEYVSEAFGIYISKNYIDWYMTALFFLSGITTLVGYFIVGAKCATFLSVKYGKGIYMLYGACSFFMFSFLNQESVMLLMSISGGILMIINIVGMMLLGKEVRFE